MNWQRTCEIKYVIRRFSEPYKDTWNIRIDEMGKVQTHRTWSEKVLVQKWVITGVESKGESEWRDVPVGEES